MYSTRVADPDQHYFYKLDPDPLKSEKHDTDPDQSQNSKALEAQSGAMEDRGCYK